MSSLEPRGGSTDTFDQKGREALSSIRFCYRAAFVSVFVDAVVAIWELGITKRTTKVTWVQVVDFADVVNLLTIASGLRQMSRVWTKGLLEKKNDMEDIYVVTRTMKRVWRTSAWVIVAGSMATASSLRQYVSHPLWAYAPGGVAALALVGSIFLRVWCRKRAQRAEEAEGDITLEGAAAKTRTTAFLAARNMAFCMGAFYLAALPQFLLWIFKPKELVERAFAVFDFSELLVIGGLLGALNRSFFDAVFHATGRTKPDGDDYLALFEAQKGFYNKAGTMISFGTASVVLPRLMAGGKVLMNMLMAAKGGQELQRFRHFEHARESQNAT